MVTYQFCFCFCFFGREHLGNVSKFIGNLSFWGITLSTCKHYYKNNTVSSHLVLILALPVRDVDWKYWYSGHVSDMICPSLTMYLFLLQQCHRCLFNWTSQHRKNRIHGAIKTIYVRLLFMIRTDFGPSLWFLSCTFTSWHATHQAQLHQKNLEISVCLQGFAQSGLSLLLFSRWKPGT